MATTAAVSHAWVHSSTTTPPLGKSILAKQMFGKKVVWQMIILANTYFGLKNVLAKTNIFAKHNLENGN